jgi:hypothetical protein
MGRASLAPYARTKDSQAREEPGDRLPPDDPGRSGQPPSTDGGRQDAMETHAGVPRGIPVGPADVQPSMLRDEPPPAGDERWDALLAALAEHLAAQPDLAPPEWAEMRVRQQPWFPAELEIQRADALVWAPAAFRKHGVYLSARDLEAA